MKCNRITLMNSTGGNFLYTKGDFCDELLDIYNDKLEKGDKNYNLDEITKWLKENINKKEGINYQMHQLFFKNLKINSYFACQLNYNDIIYAKCFNSNLEVINVFLDLAQDWIRFIMVRKDFISNKGFELEFDVVHEDYIYEALQHLKTGT